MAYKPPKQQIDNNDVKNIPSSEAIYEALKYKIDQPTISGTAGQLLQLDGYTTDPDGILNEPITSWVNPPSALPSQSGNLDKVLVTDGSTASWQYAGLGAGSLGTNNVILGRDKPSALTTGTNNIYIGPSAGDSFASASHNIAIGSSALEKMTGQTHIAIGFEALRFNTTINGGNTAIGYQALKGVLAGTTAGGHFTTAIGYQAGTSMTTGHHNVFVGWSAGSAITSGTNSVFVGDRAGWRVTGSSNVAIGYSAYAGAVGQSTGSSNTIIGQSAAANLTSGSSNIVIGSGAAANLTTGGSNIIIGSTTVTATSSGNIVIGSGGSGSGNIIVGSVQTNMAGADNVSVGSGNFAALTSGARNTAIGRLAGTTVTTGNENTYIGWNSGGLGAGTGTGALALGAEAKAGANECAIGATTSPRYINTVLVGQGGADATVGHAVKIMTMRGSGPDRNLSAGSLTLAGSQSTGNQSGGAVIISTAPAGASGSSLNAHVERLRVTAAGDVGIGTATPGEKLEVAGAVLATEYRVPNYRLDPHTHDEGTETTDFTINWSNGAVHTVTLNAAGPLVITMNNPVDGGAYALRIIQGATPGTVTWPANVKWPGGTPPTLSTNTGDIDVVNLLYFDDGGGNTFYYATSALAFA